MNSSYSTRRAVALLLFICGISLTTCGLCNWAIRASLSRKQERIFATYLQANQSMEERATNLGDLRKRMLLAFGTYEGFDTMIISGAGGLMLVFAGAYFSQRMKEKSE